MAEDEIEDNFIPVARPAGSSTSVDGARTTAGFDKGRPDSEAKKSGVVQPKPQSLSKRQVGSSTIIVSPRQKGNPVLNNIKSMPWEYGDIPADFLLGQTTCALFLQLKYHRLHPEYIYTRIRNLQGKYALRLVLVMVDIPNHEESLKELSKTSLINNVTLILCWSAVEAGRYLELFKTYENAAPTSIKQHQSTSYSDRMIDFITTPRSINKTDAVALVSQFGTIRTAVNARHEEISMIAGWGDKKVQQWCTSVREPFRIERAAKRGGLPRNFESESSVVQPSTSTTNDRPVPVAADQTTPGLPTEDVTFDDDEEAAMATTLTTQHRPRAQPIASIQPSTKRSSGRSDGDVEHPEAKKRKPEDEDLSEGITAALNKLRDKK